MSNAPEPDDPLALQAQLCFAVYSASRALTGLYRELLAGTGLTYPQYLVMLVLWEQGTVPVKELGERLRLDSGTLSPLLRRLETSGLVRRIRSSQDERVVRVALTQRGTALRDSVEHIPHHVLCSSGIPENRIPELRSLLERVTSSAEAASVEVRASTEPTSNKEH
ncbi:MarR family transcriptional regulator [Haloactinospora alba]|uniref:MarR family transcriptional regulator n=1 Tax=Haloactinospora alba TaxID=405555 RepID=A0A543NIT7_9ACTN|nr:MarR family transcriptional regulator [Haloactinospora alba]TQN31736.1 MarR family transcriptional regulator [Haloactinospora alba]